MDETDTSGRTAQARGDGRGRVELLGDGRGVAPFVRRPKRICSVFLSAFA